MINAGKKVRLVDIAQEANLSVNTISKVLNGRAKEAGIALQTAERVEKIAAELGYIPNQMARCLRSQTTDTIGVYIDNITDHVRAEILHVILEELSSHGLFPLITLAEAGYRKCYEAFVRNRIEGLILCGTMPEMGSHFFNNLIDNKIKTVVVGCFYYSKETNDAFRDVSFVNVDNQMGIALQIEHLLQQGKSRIAFVAGPSGDSDMRVRENTYIDLIKHRHEPIIGNLDKGVSYLERGYRGVDLLIESKAEFDAVIAYDDGVALGVLKRLHEKGVRVPQDVAVIGFDNAPENDYLTPRLSSISQPTRQIGQKSVELLLDRIDKKAHPGSTYIPPSLVVREST